MKVVGLNPSAGKIFFPVKSPLKSTGLIILLWTFCIRDVEYSIVSCVHAQMYPKLKLINLHPMAIVGINWNPIAVCFVMVVTTSLYLSKAQSAQSHKQ